MIKTVIKNEPNLFEEITVNVFSNNNGNRSFEQKTLKVAKLGNSVTWKYSIDEDGRALFFRVDRFGDYHDETEVVDVCGCDYPIYVGDYIWFRSEGKFSTWGKMIPPKNPARRAMWENFYFVQKQACYCDTPQLKYDTIIFFSAMLNIGFPRDGFTRLNKTSELDSIITLEFRLLDLLRITE
jgi:hypothetical protein